MAQTPEQKAAAKAAKDAEKAAAKAAKDSATSVTVTHKGGSRVYSKEIHGDDFQALAKQFADQYPGATIE